MIEVPPNRNDDAGGGQDGTFAHLVAGPGEDYDVFVGRPSPWGNEFRVGVNGTQEECVRKFEEKVRADPKRVADIKKYLQGKKLRCPGKGCSSGPCHAKVLVRLANEPRENDTECPYQWPGEDVCWCGRLCGPCSVAHPP